MAYSEIKIKGSVRKAILRELPFGSRVTVIGKIKRGTYATGYKISDRNCKRMVVAFGQQVIDVCYFNLTCDAIENAISVTRAFQKPHDPFDDLPF